MVKFNGAIEYMILKNKHKYILLFLDNHSPEKYCKTSSDNIDKLFDYFLNLDKSTTFIFEELVDNKNYKSLFPNIPHLVKYLKFYNKNLKNNNFCPVDIRNIFDNTSVLNIFTNLDILFEKNNKNSNNVISNNVIYKIKSHIEKTCSISYNFLNYYIQLKNNYYLLKKAINSNIKLINIIKENQNTFLNTKIDLNYPWFTDDYYLNINEKNILEILETFYSSLLELYAISHIEYSKSKYVILYLGASHCILIFNILNKYFNYKIIRNFLNYDLQKMKYFKLEILEKITISCIEL